MRKVHKFLKFQTIELVVTQEHPKDISRARCRIIDPNTQKFYKSFNYGQIQPMKITWQSTIELPFQLQESLKFQTICEHQYGYEIQELNALYNGIIYVKPDQFFYTNTTHVFNQQGIQCGTLKFMIKVIERQEEKKEEKVVAKQVVSVNLMAKISIYSAFLSVAHHFLGVFHRKKKRNLKLEIHFGQLIFHGTPKFGQLQYKWGLTCKFEVNENSPSIILIKVLDDQQEYLQGTVQISVLEQNKRFTVQIIQLYDSKNDAIATLHLDMRFISKKQLLDLMYSPNQLSDQKPEQKSQKLSPKTLQLKKIVDDVQKKKRVAQSVAQLKPHKKLVELLHKQSTSRDLSNHKNRFSPNNRYKISVLTGNQEPSMPKSKRFSERKDINDQISYIDPSIYSDFSPQHRVYKGATQSTSLKTDFTKHLKANPGVGQYHLPSIWQKA